MDGLIIDSFAGGGGASTGIEMALGRSPDFAINHDPKALAMHAANHPDTVHLTENIWKVDPDAVTQGSPVFLLWASPDCRHHSKAKGGAPVSKSVRGLANVVILWAKKAKPQIISLENVEEFQDWGPLNADGRPCPVRKGIEFGRWVRALEAEGYAVEWRQLRACDYGAPTIRKRLYVIARRDRKPILWPEPTHGDPKSEAVKSGTLKPWRTAAEIIDWSIPCPSIFLTREEARAGGLNVIRPLAPKTLSRIARGFKRYVLDRPEPFVVALAHGDSGGRRAFSIHEPHRTVSTSGTEHALVTPIVSYGQHGGASRQADAPLHTVCASRKDQNQILVPHLMTMRNAGKPFEAADAPTHTITAGGAALTLVEAQLGAAFVGQQNTGVLGRSADAPLATITTIPNQITPIMGYLVPRYGESGGQEPRSRGLDQPGPTVVPTGNGGDLVSPYLAVFKNHADGAGADEPISTIQTAGTHHGLVLPHLSAYYGNGEGAHADDPLRTVTTNDRFAHVEGAADAPPLADWQMTRARQVAELLRAEGVWDGGEFVTLGPFIVWDIGMRMLTPRELASAQGFRPGYVLAAPLPDGGTLTETDQRHKIGNSVCPDVAAAVLRANCIEALERPNVRRKRAVVPVHKDNAATPSLFEVAA